MKKISDDLRVRRTHKMLQEALIELVIEEGFDAVTVQKLAERAMINRATFYRHFQDKYDLVERVYAGQAEEYSRSLQAAKADSPYDLFLLLFEHIGRYRDFFRAMLRTMPQFQSWVRRNIEEEIRLIFLQLGGDEKELDLPLEVILRYLSSAQIGVVQWWLESDGDVSNEEAALALMKLHLEGGFRQLGFDQALSEM